MALDQIENPPENHTQAPQGEIRQEPLPTLRRFSLFMAAAFVLPAIGMLVGGFELHRESFEIIGVILLVGLGTLYFLVLFQIMKSRKVVPSERTENGNRSANEDRV